MSGQPVINSLPDHDSELIDEIDQLPEAPIEIGPAGSIKQETLQRTLAEQELPVHFHINWESRYVTEGRANLEDHSLTSVSTDLSYGKFSFAPWVAANRSLNYRELNLNFVYGYSISKDIKTYTSYTYLYTDEQVSNYDDNEIAIDINFSTLEYFNFITRWYYSFDSVGSYYELVALYKDEFADKFEINFSVKLGINDGYIGDGHTGLDHGQIRINLTYYPLRHIEIFGYLSTSQAVNQDLNQYPGDINLDDYNWLGIGSTYRF